MPNQNQSILLGALVTALLGVLITFATQGGGQIGQMVGVIAACCVPALGGAIMAVWHYTDAYDLTLSSGAGAKLGAITGAVGSVIATLVSLLLRYVGVLPGTEAAIEAQRQLMLDQGYTEEQIEQGLRFAEMFSSPGAQAVAAVLGILLFALIGAAGGAAGSALFKKGGNEPTVYGAE